MAKKSKPFKFNVGDKVYSYQNPTVARAVNRRRKSDDPKYDNAYILALKHRDGTSYSSKWIDESSLRKTKKRR